MSELKKKTINGTGGYGSERRMIHMLINFANFCRDRAAATSSNELRYHTSSGTLTRKP